MLLETRVHRPHLEDIDKLIVVCGRILNGMDHWERKFAFGQVLTKPFCCGHLDESISTLDRGMEDVDPGLTSSEERLL